MGLQKSRSLPAAGAGAERRLFSNGRQPPSTRRRAWAPAVVRGAGRHDPRRFENVAQGGELGDAEVMSLAIGGCRLGSRGPPRSRTGSTTFGCLPVVRSRSNRGAARSRKAGGFDRQPGLLPSDGGRTQRRRDLLRLLPVYGRLPLSGRPDGDAHGEAVPWLACLPRVSLPIHRAAKANPLVGTSAV